MKGILPDRNQKIFFVPRSARDIESESTLLSVDREDAMGGNRKRI